MKKIAVMLPVASKGESFRLAKKIACLLSNGANLCNEDLKVVFSYSAEGEYDLYADFIELKENGISTRATRWEIMKRETLLSVLPLLRINPLDIPYAEYSIPADTANYFYDCDFWLILSDHLTRPIFPLKQFACVITGYPERYNSDMPQGVNEDWRKQGESRFTLAHHANSIIITSHSVEHDVIAYGGNHPSRIVHLETGYAPMTKSENIKTKLPQAYCLWETALRSEKNLLNTLKALELYYKEYKGNLDVVLLGEDTQYLDIKYKPEPGDPTADLPIVQAWLRKIKSSVDLSKRVHVLGDVSTSAYVDALENCEYLLSPAIHDYGTDNILDAAYFKKLSLASQYPATEHLNQKYHLNLTFINPNSATDIAKKMSYMETACKTILAPGGNLLTIGDTQEISKSFYRAVLSMI